MPDATLSCLLFNVDAGDRSRGQGVLRRQEQRPLPGQREFYGASRLFHNGNNIARSTASPRSNCGLALPEERPSWEGRLDAGCMWGQIGPGIVCARCSALALPISTVHPVDAVPVLVSPGLCRPEGVQGPDQKACAERMRRLRRPWCRSKKPLESVRRLVHFEHSLRVIRRIDAS